MPPQRRTGGRLRSAAVLALAITAAAALSFGQGCSMFKKAPGKQSTRAAAAPSSTATPAVAAAVSITYAHRNDSLKSLTVTKYQGAQMIATRMRGKDTESIVRFDGGIPVWVIRSGGLLDHLPGLSAGRVNKVNYGKLPKGFAQVTPDSGPPEPLETGHFYVFTVHRALGATDYDVVKVMPDGTLVAYSAEPRAGSSYLLCCNLGADFAAVGAANPASEQGSPNDP